MACLSAETISAMLAGGLSAQEKGELDEHISQCAECRRLLAETARSLIPATGADVLSSGNKVGRYVILDLLGQGGMGVVYSAFDPELDRRVALKFLRQDSASDAPMEQRQARLLREAKVMARLSHPNVVTVHDAGTFGGQVFIALAHVEGQTVSQWLRAQPRTWKQIVDVFVSAGRGLAAAHAAGIVHRDFKPDNVLVAQDGRVLVTDFGLARSMGDPGEAAPLPLEEIGTTASLTRSGLAVGTPAYMAPEQMQGARADARTDQFAFCVAFYEALYGELPFSGNTLADLASSAAQGEVREPAKGTRVPAWIRRCLLRGLQSDPSARFPSMTEMLVALDRAPVRRRRRLELGALASVVAVGACLGVAHLVTVERARLCAGAGQRLVGTWDAEREAAVGAAFRATDMPYAVRALQGSVASIEAYARAWTAMHREACEATRLRGEQSEQLLDARMACLDERLAELRALVATFAAADADIVRHSVEAAAALTPVEACSNRLTRAPRPTDPKARAALEDGLAALAEAKALQHAGKYKKALEVARRADQLLADANSPPDQARARLQLGVLQRLLSDPKAAHAQLLEAAILAERAQASETAALAWSELVLLHAVNLPDFEQAESWARYAEAAADRQGKPAELAIGLSQSLGKLRREQGRYDDAAALYQRAFELQGKQLGSDHPELVRTLLGLGAIRERQGKFPESEQAMRQALQLAEKIYGPDHPVVAECLRSLGSVLNDEGRFAEAVAVLRRAVSIDERAIGEGQELANGLNNLAITLTSLGEYSEADGQLQRALAMSQHALGEGHPDLARFLNNLGLNQVRQKRYAQALEYYQRAESILEKALGAEHPRLALSLALMGEAYLGLGEPGKAMAVLRRALPLAEKERRALDWVLIGTGETLLAQKKPTEAVVVFERALAESHQTAPGLARMRFDLARTLDQLGKDLPRAIELARLAQQGCRESPKGCEVDPVAIDGWIASHAR